MVFFSCNVCNEALKKNQVEKHCMTKCRNCQSVCCIDCGQDFWGNDFEKHTKCISEDQKYSGKGYVAKVNKGEAKQDRWIEQVQSAIDNQRGGNPRLRGTLESIKNYPNIPRKKNKFENFLMNSLRIRDPGLISQLWNVLMEQAVKNMQHAAQDKQDHNKAAAEAEKTLTQQTFKTVSVKMDTQRKSRKSKRERKEERRKKMNKKEKKDKSGADDEDEEPTEEQSKSKKKKKRKREEEQVEVKGKKRKRMEEDEVEEEPDEPEEEEEEPVKKKTKFDWESVITEVLTSKGEIAIKKLKKKVISEYLSQMGPPKSEEKLWAKFEKKVSKNPNFKVTKERVKLVGET
ncbi:LOW QUALITY PROTEIN: cell growth-regulating nucleolar protein-like [Haliotis rubra]|uniref:LOW QUALITY PROTEIN: cell growth-regulating nucleolar protein-like n=1 Tax=Haliotis rubra TaxID=36100 RepID=UPI001EE4FD28|nr:LOW QUALITY PROTEIN: cell growth-regulating nucleolar protein-like [Haliotis rubra]